MLTEVKNPSEYTFIDGCSGSGIMSIAALKNGFKVISNDNMIFPSIIAEGQVVNWVDVPEIMKHIDNINKLPGVQGFFYKNFWLKGRLYFSEDNTKKIDACREYIDKISNVNIQNTLLFFGLEALSRTSNTTGVQAAYLKKLKERAQQPFLLKFEQDRIILTTERKVQSFTKDIIDLVKDIKETKSILYFDPPYTNRQFPPNYHLYETFVRNDNPELKGMTGLRKEWIQEAGSELCKKEGLRKAIRDMIQNSSSEYIYMSYNTDGLLTEKEIRSLLVYLNVKDFKILHWITTRYKSDIKDNRTYNKKRLMELLIKIRLR